MIRKVFSFLDQYRLDAVHAADLHALAGRGTQREITQFVNRRILANLSITAEDDLVDIGCGDGELLRLAAQHGVRSAVGVSGSEEEASRLRKTGLNVVQGFTDSLPFADSSASVVVCNSVLVIVPRERIAGSLREIARIARPAARILVGEIPDKLENADVPRHRSVPAMLWWLLRKRGVRSFVGMCRRLFLSFAKRQPFFLDVGGEEPFFATCEEFRLLAEECGLALERSEPHQELGRAGEPRDSECRWNYFFRRLGA